MDTDKHRLKIMKYNKWTLIIGVAALLATVSTFAQTNPPAAAPALTPAQIDNLGNGLNAGCHCCQPRRRVCWWAW